MWKLSSSLLETTTRTIICCFDRDFKLIEHRIENELGRFRKIKKNTGKPSNIFEFTNKNMYDTYRFLNSHVTYNPENITLLTNKTTIKIKADE